MAVKWHHRRDTALRSAVGTVLPTLRSAFEHRNNGCVVPCGHRHSETLVEARQR
jgi:hypothetical protein